MATITEPTIGAPPPLKPGPPRGGGGDGGGDGGSDQSRSGTTARIAVYIGMVASTMTFTALLSAMFVRRGLATNNDWHRLPVFSPAADVSFACCGSPEPCWARGF